MNATQKLHSLPSLDSLRRGYSIFSEIPQKNAFDTNSWYWLIFTADWFKRQKHKVNICLNSFIKSDVPVIQCYQLWNTKNVSYWYLMWDMFVVYLAHLSQWARWAFLIEICLLHCHTCCHCSASLEWQSQFLPHSAHEHSLFILRIFKFCFKKHGTYTFWYISEIEFFSLKIMLV